MNIETSVREGAEKMLAAYRSGSSKASASLVDEARMMHGDARGKTEYIRTELLRRQRASVEPVARGMPANLFSRVTRIAELRRRIGIENLVHAGALRMTSTPNVSEHRRPYTLHSSARPVHAVHFLPPITFYP